MMGSELAGTLGRLHPLTDVDSNRLFEDFLCMYRLAIHNPVSFAFLSNYVFKLLSIIFTEVPAILIRDDAHYILSIPAVRPPGRRNEMRIVVPRREEKWNCI
jgi:hypothetical protein